MNSWCESCARKNCCYVMEIRPKCYLPTTNCEHQIYDRNPDGTINIVECGYEPKDEPQTERSE